MTILNYISAVQDKEQADALNRRMVEYYQSNHQYYDDIDFAVAGWKDASHLLFQDIIERCKLGAICEVGCGASGILRAQATDASRYHGCDFSSTLIAKNKAQFPDAEFRIIDQSPALPFESASFETVFCICVLEHVVYPHLFLQELVRLCRPNGTVIILCPDFYGRLGITSQMAGRSGMSGRQKLAKGHWLDALKTLVISRLLMPRYLKRRLANATRDPLFLLNTNPSCFHHAFYPDADAVYVTHEGEIDTTLERLGATRIPNRPDVEEFAKQNRMIYAVYNLRSTSN